MSETIVSAENISVTRGDTEILKNVSVSLYRGETLAIIGPNGAGKTTFMKALLGLIQFSGTVSWSPKIRIGYVPQKISIAQTFPLTVAELFWLKRATPEQWLDRVGAAKLKHKKLSALSGGELQRTMIAYALAGDVDVLCLDEPSAGIDIGGGQTVYSLLSDLRETERKTIALISHDIDVVFRHADQVLCIDKRMICNGKPAAVLTADTIERMYGAHAGLYHHHDHA